MQKLAASEQKPKLQNKVTCAAAHFHFLVIRGQGRQQLSCSTTSPEETMHSWFVKNTGCGWFFFYYGISYVFHSHVRPLGQLLCRHRNTTVIKHGFAITAFASPQLPPNTPQTVPSATHQPRVTTSARLLPHSCKKTVASEHPFNSWSTGGQSLLWERAFRHLHWLHCSQRKISNSASLPISQQQSHPRTDSAGKLLIYIS